jgi:hypothetical protein
MNKKNDPQVLKDGARIVGGSDARKVTESPPHMEHQAGREIPGHDAATHSHLAGPGKKRFPLKGKSGW